MGDPQTYVCLADDGRIVIYVELAKHVEHAEYERMISVLNGQSPTGIVLLQDPHNRVLVVRGDHAQNYVLGRYNLMAVLPQPVYDIQEINKLVLAYMAMYGINNVKCNCKDAESLYFCLPNEQLPHAAVAEAARRLAELGPETFMRICMFCGSPMHRIHQCDIIGSGGSDDAVWTNTLTAGTLGAVAIESVRVPNCATISRAAAASLVATVKTRATRPSKKTLAAASPSKTPDTSAVSTPRAQASPHKPPAGPTGTTSTALLPSRTATVTITSVSKSAAQAGILVAPPPAGTHGPLTIPTPSAASSGRTTVQQPPKVTFNIPAGTATAVADLLRRNAVALAQKAQQNAAAGASAAAPAASPSSAPGPRLPRAGPVPGPLSTTVQQTEGSISKKPATPSKKRSRGQDTVGGITVAGAPDPTPQKRMRVSRSARNPAASPLPVPGSVPAPAPTLTPAAAAAASGSATLQQAAGDQWPDIMVPEPTWDPSFMFGQVEPLDARHVEFELPEAPQPLDYVRPTDVVDTMVHGTTDDTMQYIGADMDDDDFDVDALAARPSHRARPQLTCTPDMWRPVDAGQARTGLVNAAWANLRRYVPHSQDLIPSTHVFARSISTFVESVVRGNVKQAAVSGDEICALLARDYYANIIETPAARQEWHLKLSDAVFRVIARADEYKLTPPQIRQLEVRGSQIRCMYNRSVLSGGGIVSADAQRAHELALFVNEMDLAADLEYLRSEHATDAHFRPRMVNHTAKKELYLVFAVLAWAHAGNGFETIDGLALGRIPSGLAELYRPGVDARRIYDRMIANHPATHDRAPAANLLFPRPPNSASANIRPVIVSACLCSSSAPFTMCPSSVGDCTESLFHADARAAALLVGSAARLFPASVPAHDAPRDTRADAVLDADGLDVNAAASPHLAAGDGSGPAGSAPSAQGDDAAAGLLIQIQDDYIDGGEVEVAALVTFRDSLDAEQVITIRRVLGTQQADPKMLAPVVISETLGQRRKGDNQYIGDMLAGDKHRWVGVGVVDLHDGVHYVALDVTRDQSTGRHRVVVYESLRIETVKPDAPVGFDDGYSTVRKNIQTWLRGVTGQPKAELDIVVNMLGWQNTTSDVEPNNSCGIYAAWCAHYIESGQTPSKPDNWVLAALRLVSSKKVSADIMDRWLNEMYVSNSLPPSEGTSNPLYEKIVENAKAIGRIKA